MAVFFPQYPIDKIQGAEYNPRRIDEESKAALRHSITVLGVCKPIIVSGQTIVAGHQRTNALRAIGVTAAPVVVLKDVKLGDEIRFNQLHNGTDFDSGDENVSVGPSQCEPRQFEMAKVLTGNSRARLAIVRGASLGSAGYVRRSR